MAETFALRKILARSVLFDALWRQAPRNLLHNADLHTPPWGSPTVRTVRDSTHAALTPLGSRPGIAAELSRRLF